MPSPVLLDERPMVTPADWNIPQTVTITGVDDLVADGSVAYTIVLANAVSTDVNYSGLKPSNVSVVNSDNEGGITVAPTSGLITRKIVASRPPRRNGRIGIGSTSIAHQPREPRLTVAVARPEAQRSPSRAPLSPASAHRCLGLR